MPRFRAGPPALRAIAGSARRDFVVSARRIGRLFVAGHDVAGVVQGSDQVVDGDLVYDKQDELYFAHIRPRDDSLLAPLVPFDPAEVPLEEEEDGEDSEDEEGDSEDEEGDEEE